MAIDKLNFPTHTDYQVDHTIPDNQKFSADELNAIASKIDEIIDAVDNKPAESIPLTGTVEGSPLSGSIEIDNSDDRMFYSKYYGAYLMFGGDGTVEINQTNGSNVYINGLDISAKNSSGDGIQGAAYYGANYIDNSFVQKKYVDDKVGSVYKIKGSVANYASLPSAGQIEGDVWNLINTGENYVWVLNLNNTGIAGWDKLSSTTVVELDTLATVMNRGNYAAKPIYFVNGDEEYTSLGMHPTTYSMFWGNMNRNHTGDVNIAMGYDSMGSLTTGTSNAGYAVGALNLLTTGSRNTALGQGALNKVSVNSDNTAVGQASFYNLTGFKNTGVGVNTGTSLTTGNLNTLLGYKANNTSNFGDRNIFIGAYSAAGVTGSNNIIIGTGSAYGDGSISNKLIIHNNHTSTGYSNTSDGSMSSPTLGNLTNALISGDFSERTLSFNSTLQVKLLPNADSDATFTKQVVAKADGTFGLKTGGGSYIPLAGTAAGSPVTGDVQLTGGRLYSGTIGGNYSKLQATSSYIQLQAYSGMTSAFVMVQPNYIGIWGNSSGGVRIEVSPTGILMGGLVTIINDYSYNKRPVLNSSGEVKLITEPKKYVASMRSNGTTAGLVVFENTIGAIVWTRTNVGEYQGVLSGAFTADKVAIFAQCAQGNGGTGYPLNIIAGRIDANTVYIKVTRTDDSATPFEFTGEIGSLEIRVYN